MKLTKKDTTLKEKDALQDMLEAEKLLMSYYAAGVTEGSCKPFRKEILKNYTEGADTQFTVFEQMLSRGYYRVQPAPKPALDEKTDVFQKVMEELNAG